MIHKSQNFLNIMQECDHKKECTSQVLRAVTKSIARYKMLYDNENEELHTVKLLITLKRQIRILHLKTVVQITYFTS
jgi:hypothetical protein